MNANYLYNVAYIEEAIKCKNKNMEGNNNKYLKDIDIAIREGIKKINQTNQQLTSIESFKMKSLYPGVLIGTGYPHETGAENEFHLGFTFDYVTGVPYLPGSSLKGILRSAFTYGEDNKPEYIMEQMKDFFNNNKITEEKDKVEFIKNLCVCIFGESREDINNTNESVLQKSQIIFLDSYVIKKCNKKNKYMGIDYITPHGKGKDKFKDPIPVAMIRINPEVVFEFRFIIPNDICVNNIDIDKEELLKLFKNIICDFGIGAKTNVGYGNLVEYNEN